MTTRGGRTPGDRLPCRSSRRDRRETFRPHLSEGGQRIGIRTRSSARSPSTASRRRIRFHDYHEIFKIPGLYEQLFYEELKCDSPRTIAGLIGEQVDNDTAADLRVLDVGAGNGMVGEELDRMGAKHIVGVDIIEEAAEAAERDRPGIYDDYFVVDLTDIPADDQRALEEHRFNCLTTVAALGFGDIPPEAFAAAYNLVEDGGLIAFNIKERFVDRRRPQRLRGADQPVARRRDDGPGGPAPLPPPPGGVRRPAVLHRDGGAQAQRHRRS